jgi:hypothetical protein
VDVEEEDVEHFFAKAGQGVAAVGDGDRGVAERAQDLLNHAQVQRIVIDVKDLQRPVQAREL